MPHHFKAGEGALYAQIDGPNTRPLYLGCHQVGDIAEPLGDITYNYCPDESGVNRFKVVSSVQGNPGAITTTITYDITDSLDWLERVRCPFTLFVNMIESGRKDIFNNFRRSFILRNTRVTNRGVTGVAARTPDDNARSEQTADVSAEELLRVVDLALTRQSVTETSNINDVTFCNDERCRTDESLAQEICQIGFASTDAPVGSPSSTANVLHTTNGGTWTATATDPFATSEDISGIECFEIGEGATRVIVSRGTTDGAHAAEVAVSDDAGVTWLNVDVGVVHGEFMLYPHALFALNGSNIWFGSSAGRIYYSENSGAVWSIVLDTGVITANDWTAIKFVDELNGWAVGEANIVARTIDGGQGWSSVTAPSAQSGINVTALEVFDRNRAWIGYANGKSYYTIDAGITWTERAYPNSGVGQVRAIGFLNDLYGIILQNNGTPIGTVLRTIDGGYNWKVIATPTNAGLNTLWVCDQWNFYFAGEAQGGTAYIAKGSL